MAGAAEGQDLSHNSVSQELPETKTQDLTHLFLYLPLPCICKCICICICISALQLAIGGKVFLLGAIISRYYCF